MNALASQALLSCCQTQVAISPAHLRCEQYLIDTLTWDVLPSERWAILGGNGVGKSTLLHTLLGMNAFRGQVYLQGESLHSLTPRAQAQRRVWVPQAYEEPFSVTVESAVRSMAREANDTQVTMALAKFGLMERARDWVHHLSGGQRQRLTWAMAEARSMSRALSQPLLWMMDEPFAAQDVAWQKQLLTQLHGLAHHYPDDAIVVTVHDLNLVRHFASHVLLLGHGRVLAQGRYEEVMRADSLSAAFGTPVRVAADGAIAYL